jgi:hypothetical protein
LILAFIYKITNTINGKIYVGKTEISIEKRFKEHCKDSKKIKNEKRPLYNAMRKYGVENFIIEKIEETNNPIEREGYWIEYYDSFKNGYNATLGGDGKNFINYDLVIQTYEELKNQKEVAEKLHICVSTVRRILKNNGVKRIKNIQGSKKIEKYDLKGNYIKSYLSAAEAAREIINEMNLKSNSNTVGNRIRECANEKTKSAYGYTWKFVNDIDKFHENTAA